MTVALRSPSRLGALIAVDNAPVDVGLKGDFGTYVQGMRQVEESKVMKQVEADAMLKAYVKVKALIRSQSRIPRSPLS